MLTRRGWVKYLDSIIIIAYQDIDIIQKSHDHLFQNLRQLGNTNFAVKFWEPLENEAYFAVQ